MRYALHPPSRGAPRVTGGDAHIAPLLAAGSPEGIEALYDSCGALAYTLALRILRDAGAAEDVVQEAFLSIWRRGESYAAARGTLRGWVCTIVRNRAIDRLRSGASRSGRDVSIDQVAASPSGFDTWQEVSDELTRQQLHQALDELPPEQREALELTYFQGMTQAEVSRLTDTPLGTVKSRMRLAMNRLRAVLERTEASWQNS